MKELRAVLWERGGQRHVDMASTRDAALEALGARDARIHELQTTVHEMTEQLQRQAKALALGAPPPTVPMTEQCTKNKPTANP